MIHQCPQCGKEFDVLWPHLWSYKRGQEFLCTYTCLRAYDEGKEANKMQKITLEQKKQAVEIAISGTSPLDFLRKCGSKAPEKTWYAIKAALRHVDPEKYAQIPDFRKTDKETPKEPTAVKLTGPIKIEEVGNLESFGHFHNAERTPPPPQKPKITKPLKYDGFAVQAIKGDYGRYSRSSCSGTDYIDFTSNNGEELSMPISAWKDFLEELNRAANVLGVEL